jgi:phosphoglycolate phosphatase
VTLGVLFDLDGTLADTAPDLGAALNTLLQRYGRTTLPLEQIRPWVSQGARGLLSAGFGIKPGEPFFDELRDEFLQLYQQDLANHTRLFSDIPPLLDILDQRQIPWGIVTNKLMRYTNPLVAALGLDTRAGCVVSGDSFDRPKPWPDPLLGAAGQLGLDPASLVYVGDDERDMQAAQAAGMPGIVAGYGYLGGGNPHLWNSVAVIANPLELLNHL